MTGEILSRRALNRSLLARQHLLERATLPVSVAMERVGGLQTQYAPAGYIGLWSRLAGSPGTTSPRPSSTAASPRGR